MSLGILGGGGSKAARPLAFSGLGRSVRGLRGLGGALGASNLPGSCWDAAGFKDCHAKAYAEAQAECAGGLAQSGYGGDMGTCVERNADAYAWAGCVNKYCPQSTKPKISGPQPLAWKNTSYNSLVAEIQKKVNPYLKKLGANQIGVDGKLGPGTCGAAYFVDGVEGTTIYSDYGMASVCKALSMPTKAGTTTPMQTIAVTPQVTHTATETIVEKTDLPWDVFDADTQAVQQRLNVQLDASDMNPLTVDGRLNAPTCGAMRWMKNTQGIDLLSVQGKNCQGFTDPTKKIKPATPVTVPSSTDTSPTLPANPKPAFSAASMATTGLILGALGVGVYALNKKYHWFG